MNKSDEFNNILNEILDSKKVSVNLVDYSNRVGSENLASLNIFLIKKGIIVNDGDEVDSNDDIVEEDDVAENYEETLQYTKDPDTFKMFLDELVNYPMLSDDDFKENFLKYKSAKTAGEAKKYRNIIIESNLRLVVSIAKKYIGCGIDISDLVQEGSIGLSRAVEMYNIDLGYKFSTYATWWVRQAMTRSITKKSRNIRIPDHAFILSQKISKFKHSFYQKNMRYPTNQELSDIFNISIDRVKALNMSELDTVSLSTPAIKGEEDDSEIGNLIPDESCVDPAKAAEQSDLNSKIEDVLTKFLPREADIIRRRYGLSPYEKIYTLEEIASVYNLTRERIRQIQSKAERRMRKCFGKCFDGYDSSYNKARTRY